MSPFRLSTRALPPRAQRPARRTMDPAGAVRPAAPVRSTGPVRSPGPVRSASPVEDPVSAPVPVPWRVVRRALGAIEIEHRGAETLHSVRFALSGAGMLGLSLPRRVEPGERVRVVVRSAASEGATTAHDAMLVMRWFQPDGTELLWPIALE